MMRFQALSHPCPLLRAVPDVSQRDLLLKDKTTQDKRFRCGKRKEPNIPTGEGPRLCVRTLQQDRPAASTINLPSAKSLNLACSCGGVHTQGREEGRGSSPSTKPSDSNLPKAIVKGGDQHGLTRRAAGSLYWLQSSTSLPGGLQLEEIITITTDPAKPKYGARAVCSPPARGCVW